jgi:hypothetical protein
MTVIGRRRDNFMDDYKKQRGKRTLLYHRSSIVTTQVDLSRAKQEPKVIMSTAVPPFSEEHTLSKEPPPQIEQLSPDGQPLTAEASITAEATEGTKKRPRCETSSADEKQNDSVKDDDEEEEDEDDEDDEEEEAGLSLLFEASLLQNTSKNGATKKKKGSKMVPSTAQALPDNTAASSATANNTLLTSEPSHQSVSSSSTTLITSVLPHDVLCGRGGHINKHPGNIIYRNVVEYNKSIYRQVPKRHRILVSKSIVQAMLNHNGRFLQAMTSKQGKKTTTATKGDNDGDDESPSQQEQQEQETCWEAIDFRRAVSKTSQALREAPCKEAGVGATYVNATLMDNNTEDQNELNDYDNQSVPQQPAAQGNGNATAAVLEVSSTNAEADCNQSLVYL